MGLLKTRLELWSVRSVKNEPHYETWVIEDKNLWIDGFLITGHDMSLNVDGKTVSAGFSDTPIKEGVLYLV